MGWVANSAHLITVLYYGRMRDGAGALSDDLCLSNWRQR